MQYVLQFSNILDDIYPFKFEIIKAIREFEKIYPEVNQDEESNYIDEIEHNSNRSSQSNNNSEFQRRGSHFFSLNCVLAFQMMFKMYSKRDQVVKYVIQNRLYKYLSKYNHNFIFLITFKNLLFYL